MATPQTFETIVKLNAQQTKNEMAALQKPIDDLKKKKTDALSIPGTSAKDINKINKEIKAAEAALKAYSSSVAKRRYVSFFTLFVGRQPMLGSHNIVVVLTIMKLFYAYSCLTL